jgi:multicomponent K+:H+ antiporter subunit D
MAILGLAFIGCALVISGLPPLSVHRQVCPTDSCAQSADWRCLDRELGYSSGQSCSGLAALIAMTRAGIRAFWASRTALYHACVCIEIAPVGALLLLCAIQTIRPVRSCGFMRATAQSLHAPHDYIRGVLGSAAERPKGLKGPT